MAPGVALLATLLLALGLPGLQSETCSVDEAQKPQLTSLLEVMLRSWNASATPSPSILLALRLAKDHNLEVEKAMIRRLKEDAVQRIANSAEFSEETVVGERNQLKRKEPQPRKKSGTEYSEEREPLKRKEPQPRKKSGAEYSEKKESLKRKEPHLRKKSDQDFSSGLVALYVLALQASCENPRNVTALNSNINLVQVLEEKYQEELRHIEEHHRPLSNDFQIGLDIIALCLQDVSVSVSAVLDTSCANGELGNNTFFSVDTAAVMVLGLTCVVDRGNITTKKREAITHTLRTLVQKILEQSRTNGEIGNIYSTGLAMQALFVSGQHYNSSQWDCNKTLAAALTAISEGKFNNPMAASQITPSLRGLTYLNAKGLNCSTDEDNLPIISTPVTPPISNLSEITVSYRIIDGVTNTFNISTDVTVPKGSTFLEVMEKAQGNDPTNFSFTVEQTSWGPMITSIHGLTASNSARTYWQLLNGTTPLDVGAKDYKPSNGENLVAKFTTW